MEKRESLNLTSITNISIFLLFCQSDQKENYIHTMFIEYPVMQKILEYANCQLFCITDLNH